MMCKGWEGRFKLKTLEPLSTLEPSSFGQLSECGIASSGLLGLLGVIPT